MDNRERNEILKSAALSDERERARRKSLAVDRYSHMSELDKSKYIDLLKEQHSKDQSIIGSLRKQLDDQIRIAQDSNKKLGEVLGMLKEDRAERKGLKEERDELLKTIKSLQEQLATANAKNRLEAKHRFSTKSQKMSAVGKTADEEDRQRDKDDFDGIGGTSGDKGSAAADAHPKEQESGQASYTADVLAAHAAGLVEYNGRWVTPRQKEALEKRKGAKYNMMKTHDRVYHLSDLSKLPQGAEIMERYFRSTIDEVVLLTDHRREWIKYKYQGQIYRGTFPYDDDPETIVPFSNTHASTKLAAHPGYNRFGLNVPAYTERQRLRDTGMRVISQTIINWTNKCHKKLAPIVDSLKDITLGKDAIVNCDETWVRVRTGGKFKKKYIWCLVNRLAKTVIYVYDDGSRGRKVLKHILEGHDIKALQSDGYNVYLYLDDDALINIDHLCCLAHARAKFLYAYEQGGDRHAKVMLDLIDDLYGKERCYKEYQADAELIKLARNRAETSAVVTEMRGVLDFLKSEEHPPRGELMEKAVSYLDKFWDQIFLFRKDGNYEIDNNIAERNIRPLTRERKNSLFFGSGAMAEVSATFHSLIQTTRAQGKSVLRYLENTLAAVNKDGCDYSQLVPVLSGR